jgi:hypothetical protein
VDNFMNELMFRRLRGPRRPGKSGSQMRDIEFPPGVPKPMSPSACLERLRLIAADNETAARVQELLDERFKDDERAKHKWLGHGCRGSRPVDMITRGSYAQLAEILQAEAEQ